MTSPEILQPTTSAQRINSLDIIRGVALLGILLMNIAGMGLPHAYSDPTIAGGSTGWNLNVWWINTMFFEGTMRSMFSMLFGAGVILFTSRKVGAINGVSVTDAYFRRVIWLVLFGMIHAYILLWHGDILYSYGIVGLFVFSFRNLDPKKLIVIGLSVLIIPTLLGLKDYIQTKDMSDQAITAVNKKAAGAELSEEESKSITTWEEFVTDEKSTEEKTNKNIEKRQKGYFSVVVDRASTNAFMESVIMYRYFFIDIFAMMLLGMAFFKNGIMKAEKSNAYFFWMVVIGYAIGLTTNYLETSYVVVNEFDLVSIYLANISYDIGRVFTTLGHLGVIILFVKSGILPWLQKAFAAVGQMALTNYISHTIITTTIFIGFAKFGTFQRYELYYIVGSIWVFQLIASPIWLKYFRFGPLEWAWRSLTYWEKQSFRKIND